LEKKFWRKFRRIKSKIFEGSDKFVGVLWVYGDPDIHIGGGPGIAMITNGVTTN